MRLWSLVPGHSKDMCVFVFVWQKGREKEPVLWQAPHSPTPQSASDKEDHLLLLCWALCSRVLRQPGQTTPPDLLLQPHSHTHTLANCSFPELLSINATVATRPEMTSSPTFDQTNWSKFKVKGHDSLARWNNTPGWMDAGLHTYTWVCSDLWPACTCSLCRQPCSQPRSCHSVTVYSEHFCIYTHLSKGFIFFGVFNCLPSGLMSHKVSFITFENSSWELQKY